MNKRIALALAFSLTCLTVESYTVILKNGKTMQGTLVSETADTILFKDEHGIQFSLKKSALDLQGMQEANAVPAAAEEPPPPLLEEELPAAEKPAPATKKKATRVYTIEDVEALKDKYGDLTTGERPPAPPEETAVEPSVRPETVSGEGEQYLDSLRDASTRILALTKNMTAFSTGIATVAEIASSSAQDSEEAIRNYIEGAGARNLRNSINSDLKYLQELRSTLSRIPAGYEPAYNLFTKALEELPKIKAILDRPEAFADNATRFQNNVKDGGAAVEKIVSQLQAWQPPQPSKPETETVSQ